MWSQVEYRGVRALDIDHNVVYYRGMNALTENKFLTDLELEQLLATCEKYGGRDSLVIRFTLYTGARGCEVRKVRKSHLGNGAVTIYGAKGSNNRMVPLSAKFFQEVIEYCQGMDDKDFIFPMAVRTLRHIWAQFRPNPNKGFHCLRHSFGVRLYNNCEDIHVVKTALGHVSISSTLVYLDFVEGQRKLKKAIKSMWSKKMDLHEVA